nr:uncharacterized protein LOC102150068 isoform X10 [Equus caballus]
MTCAVDGVAPPGGSAPSVCRPSALKRPTGPRLATGPVCSGLLRRTISLTLRPLGSGACQVEVPCKARCRPPTEEDPSCPVTSAGARQSRRKCGPGCAPRPRTAQDGGISEQSLPSPKKRRPSCRLWSGDARESRKKRGFGCAPCPWLAEAGGISEQSLPSPKKRRPSCRLWSGDARESRKKRGFGCAPCPWVAEAGGRAVQSSLPPTDRRRPFVSRDERRCEAVAAEVWPGMRTTPSDGPGRHGRSEGPLPLERTGTGTGTTPGVRIWEPWHLGVLPLTA